jgi:hypothetical protein
MHYVRPAIEERFEVRALLGVAQISGGGGDFQPIWRVRKTRGDASSAEQD